MYYVYILQNRDGRFYVGQTSNLEERVKRHNSGRSEYTSHAGPWELVYREEFDTRSSACKREREIKNWKSARRIRELIALG